MNMIHLRKKECNMNQNEKFNTYAEIIDILSKRFLYSIYTDKIKHQLIDMLKKSYPKISINLTVHIQSDNSIYIAHHNNFFENLKKYYPEALF